MSHLTGPWGPVMRAIGSAAANTASAIDKSVRDEAFLFKKTLTFNIRNGGSPRFKRLSGLTILLRSKAGEVRAGATRAGGTKPLIATGSLFRSSSIQKKGFARYEVGVQRMSPKGVNIAAVQEFGATIDVQKNNFAVWRWFMFLFLKGIIDHPISKNRPPIVIPPRPFFQPVVNRFRKGYLKRLEARIFNYMGGRGRLNIPTIAIIPKKLKLRDPATGRDV